MNHSVAGEACNVQFQLMQVYQKKKVWSNKGGLEKSELTLYR